MSKIPELSAQLYACPPSRLAELAEINSQSAYYNLTLSDKDILGLIEERGAALRNAERIEFGLDTLECIINVLYKSPYVNQFEYTEIINEFQYLFYVIKNETGEVFSDEKLIQLMSELFDGPCNGSLELLKGNGADYIIGRANRKKSVWSRKKAEYRKDSPHTALAVDGAGGGLIASYSEDMLNMLAQSLAVMLEELSLRHTKGRSFSIKAETAQSIVNSILYAAQLSGEREIYESDKLRAAYAKGLEEIEARLAAAKQVYQKAKETRTPTLLKSYNSTIDEEIPAFFKAYDKTFDATWAPVFSYRTLLENAGLQGVSYVEDYLGKLSIENELCAVFDDADVETLLSASVENEPFSVVTVNISGLCLTNSLFAVLLGKPPKDIVLSEIHRQVIARDLKTIAENGEKIYTVIEDAVEGVKGLFENDNQRGYVEKYAVEKLLPEFTAKLNMGRAYTMPVYL